MDQPNTSSKRLGATILGRLWRRRVVMAGLLSAFTWMSVAAAAPGGNLGGYSSGYAVGPVGDESFRGRKAAPAEGIEPAVRRPVAAATSPDGRWMYVANRQFGTLTIVDLPRRQAVEETAVGSRLSALVRIAPNALVVADDQAHQLRLLRADGADVRVIAQVAVSPYPAELAWHARRRRLYVSCLWTRRVDVFEVDAAACRMMRVDRAELDFAPRLLQLVPERDRLIIADAFGGQLQIMDTGSWSEVARRALPAHNIGGLAIADDSGALVVSQQILSEFSQTLNPDVHWGMLMSNDLRWLRLNHVLDPDRDLFAGAHILGLGQPNDAAGDPRSVLVRSDGLTLVALAGVDELAYGREADSRFRRVRVGDRPMWIGLSPDGQTAYTVDYFDDAVSVVDLAQGVRTAQIALGPPAPQSARERGERLFYDARLSLDGWMSCHSCHTDGHTSGLRSDNLGDGTFGAPKRILSLLGLADTAPYAWNASAETLEQQLQKSVTQTMQGPRQLAAGELSDLASFLRSLRPPEGIDALRGTIDPDRWEMGRQAFQANRCASCHRPPMYTTPRTYDVGLSDELGKRRFNPPSLRGVSQRGPLFHDNRAASLPDVLHEYRHRLGDQVEATQIDALLAYLRSL